MSFVNILTALMSSDNVQRPQAEVMYNEMISTQLLLTVFELLTVFSTATFPLDLRSFSGILLRRVLEKTYQKENEHLFTPEILAQIRNGLLQIWSSESEGVILRHLSHVLAQSAYLSQWKDLISNIIAISTSNTYRSPIPMLGLIEILAEYSPLDILENLDNLGAFLITYLSSSDANIQVATAKAIGSCMVAVVDDESARMKFKSSLNPMISILGTALSNGNEFDATAIMEHLVTIAAYSPVFFRSTLDGIIPAFLSIASADSLEFSTRAMALEFMVTIAEQAPALARRCKALTDGIIPLSFSMMLEIEEEEDEFISEKYSQEPGDENCVAGEDAIDRLSFGLGGKTVSGLILSLVQENSSSTEWTKRRASIVGLHRFCEGSSKFAHSFLEQIVNFLRNALSDSSQRVRYDAIGFVGRLPALFTDDMPQFVEKFVPMLTALLCSPDVCDRVRGHAASAMINLINPENISSEIINPYLDPLLSALVVCLQSASVEVQPTCLVLLGVTANAAESAFIPYYNHFMPGIKTILNSSTARDVIELRGKAMECAAFIGDAVGVDLFANDAYEIMTTLIHAMGQDQNSDSTFEFILPACARISKALGEKFEPFLPHTIQPLLVGANQDINFHIEDANEDDEEGEEVTDEELRTQSTVLNLGGVKKRFTVNTYAIGQKKMAATMLYDFASNMKGELKSYLPLCMQALLPMILEKNSSDIRASAALALSKVYEAYIDAAKKGYINQPALQQVFDECSLIMQNSLTNEINQACRGCSVESYRDILLANYNSGNETPDGKHDNFMIKPKLSDCPNIVTCLLKCCDESLARRAEHDTKFNKSATNGALDQEDSEAYEELLEEEDELLSNLVDSLGQLIKLHGNDFMPLFDSLIAPFFSRYLLPPQPDALQVIAICMIDDAIEFGGEGAKKYISQSLDIFTKNIQSDHLVLKQCSVYGMAQIAKVAPELFAQKLNQVLPQLIAVITTPGARDDENEGIFENIIFILGVICSLPYYRSITLSNINLSQVASYWLRALPLITDEITSKTNVSYLCDMIERNDTIIYDETSSNLGEILRIFAEIFISNANDNEDIEHHPDTILRMKNIIKNMSQTISSDTLMQSMTNLSPEMQSVIQSSV